MTEVLQLPGIHYPCTVSDDVDLDRVYTQLDDLMLAGRFADVDRLLEQVDVSLCSITVMLSYLTVTANASHRLKNRARFYDLVERRLLFIDPDRADALLSGLK